MDWLTRLEAPQNALAMLTAMITPAVLISACGALIFSTSTRLGRVIDRVRVLSDRFQEIAAHPEKDDMFEERRMLIFTQLDRQMSRARLIQRAMAAFYTALGVFVASSVAIAVMSAAARNFTWIAVVLGLIGSMFMLYGSSLLIVESRMALSAIITEMDFVSKVSRRYAGKELADRPAAAPSPGWVERSSQLSRSAVTGLTLIARRAGTSVAAIATSASTPPTSTNVSGSVGATLNSIDAMNRVSATAAARPIALANSVSSSPCRSTMRIRSPGVAPSAARTPSSRVRLVTAKAITP